MTTPLCVRISIRLLTKFYWHTATHIHLHIIYGLKYLPACLLEGKFANLCLSDFLSGLKFLVLGLDI